MFPSTGSVFPGAVGHRCGFAACPSFAPSFRERASTAVCQALCWSLGRGEQDFRSSLHRGLLPPQPVVRCSSWRLGHVVSLLPVLFAHKAPSFDTCHLHLRLKAAIYPIPLAVYGVVTPQFAKPERHCLVRRNLLSRSQEAFQRALMIHKTQPRFEHKRACNFFCLF